MPLELPAEHVEDGVELVLPSEVEVPKAGPNYQLAKPAEKKLAGRKRRQADAEAERSPPGQAGQAGEAERDGQQEAGRAAGDSQPAGRAAGEAAALPPPRQVAGRRASRLADAFANRRQS